MLRGRRDQSEPIIRLRHVGGLDRGTILGKAEERTLLDRAMEMGSSRVSKKKPLS